VEEVPGAHGNLRKSPDRSASSHSGSFVQPLRRLIHLSEHLIHLFEYL